MSKNNEKEYRRVQIRASVSSLYSTALELMSKKEKVAIGRIIDEALLAHEKFLPYLERVEKFYDY